MRDRARQIADRQQARNDTRQEQREPAWRRDNGPMTEADERALSAGQATAYERGRDGRGR